MGQPGEFREGTYWLGAALAGVAMGIGSSLPFLNMCDLCCCMWAWGPAVGLVYFMGREGYRVTPMTGLVSALAATIVGCMILLPISAVMMFLVSNPAEAFLQLERDNPGMLGPDLKNFLNRPDAVLLIWLAQGLGSALSFSLTAGLAGMIAGHFWRNDPPLAPPPGSDAPKPALPLAPPGEPVA